MAPGCPPWRRASLPPSPGLAPLCPAGREGSAVPPLCRRVPAGPAVPGCPPCPRCAPGPCVPAELPLCSPHAPRTGLPQVGWVIGALFPRPRLLALPPSFPPVPGPRGLSGLQPESRADSPPADTAMGLASARPPGSTSSFALGRESGREGGGSDRAR